MRGGEHLPAPAHQEPVQGVRGGEHLPAPAPKEPMQSGMILEREAETLKQVVRLGGQRFRL